MSEYVTEKKFVVAEGDGGELYIFLTAKKDNPAAPQIIYDGKDHAVFLRNREQKIILDYIHPDIRDKLKKAKENKHMTFYEAAEIARKAEPERLWLTHYSPSLNRPEEYLPAARKIFPKTETCKDGKTITLLFEDEA